MNFQPVEDFRAGPLRASAGMRRRWILLVVLATAWTGITCGSFAFEVVYAPTGYQVSSGMDYAIKYELKNLIARHTQVFHRKEPPEFKITYRIFPTYEAYEKYSASQKTVVNRNLLGYTHSMSEIRRDTGEIVAAEAEVISWKQEQPAIHLSTVLHETTHAVTHAFLQQVPLWMNEGSADWFGRPAWANGEAQQTERARRWQTLNSLLDKKQMPPLRAYVEAESYEEWDKLFAGRRDRGYLVGYSLFDYFMSHANAATYLATLLKQDDVERGGRPGVAFATRLDKTWHGGLAEFERGWISWIRRKSETEPVPAPKSEPGKAKPAKTS